MAGAFQTSRDIFENPIWQNIVEFRLFFLIYGNAVFMDDIKIGNMILKRGQWVRSLRNLQSDLEYVENRSIKRYSLSTIHRAIDNLFTSDRIKFERCELGTLFTVLNYARYQGLDNYKQHNENAERTRRERVENSNETEREQQRNNNNKVKKDKKDNKDKSIYAEFVTLTDDEYKKLVDEHGEEVTKQMITILDNYKGAHDKKYKSDYRAILNWVINRVKEQSKPAGKGLNKTLDFNKFPQHDYSENQLEGLFEKIGDEK